MPGRLSLVCFGMAMLLSCRARLHSPEEPSRAFSAESDRLASGVLDAAKRAVARDDWFDREFEESFYSVLEMREPAAVDARIALLNYYLGEHFGEELVCAVAKGGASVGA